MKKLIVIIFSISSCTSQINIAPEISISQKEFKNFVYLDSTNINKLMNGKWTFYKAYYRRPHSFKFDYYDSSDNGYEGFIKYQGNQISIGQDYLTVGLDTLFFNTNSRYVESDFFYKKNGRKVLIDSSIIHNKLCAEYVFRKETIYLPFFPKVLFVSESEVVLYIPNNKYVCLFKER